MDDFNTTFGKRVVMLEGSVETLKQQKQQSDAKASGDAVQSIMQLLDAKKKK